MIIRVPQNSVILLYSFNYEKNTVNTLVFNGDKELNQATAIHRGKITFTYDKKKLRPYRFEEIKGTSYRFLKARDVIQLLQFAKLIVIGPTDRPKNTNEFLEFFHSKNIQKPKIMPQCLVCLREFRKLTKLSSSTTYDLYGKRCCRDCASKEIQEEYIRRGIPLTSSAKKFFNEQLSRLKSVDKVVNSLWDPVKSTKDNESTLFDVISADENATPISFRKFINSNKLQSYFDKELVNHWYSLGITKLLPVQREAIKSGLMDKRDLLVVAGTSS
ncbi:MAG: hypothetical protein ACXAD7_16640, partial [Candidatus Kariarchaeaceae archaeon]